MDRQVKGVCLRGWDIWENIAQSVWIICLTECVCMIDREALSVCAADRESVSMPVKSMVCVRYLEYFQRHGGGEDGALDGLGHEFENVVDLFLKPS
jgi:hypothetical protein